MLLAFLLIAALTASCDKQLSKYDSVRVQTDFDYTAGIELTVDAGADIVTNVPVEREIVAVGRIASGNWEQAGGNGEVNFGAAASFKTEISAKADGKYVIRYTASSVRGVPVSDELQLTWDTTAPTPPAKMGASSTTPGGDVKAYVNSATPYLDWDDAVDVGAGVRDYDLVWYRQADCQGVENVVTGLNESHYQVSGVENNVFSYKVTTYDKLGYSSVSSCSQAITIDLTPPPALANLTGATGPTVGTVSLTATFPGNVSDYDQVVMRRVSGTLAPVSCNDGTAGTIISGSFVGAKTVDDDSGAPGGVFSYLACVYDRAGNVTGGNTTTNKTAKLHQIFATSSSHDGSIGGGAVTQADSICQTLGTSVPALAVHKQETRWKAILSTSAVDAATRIVVNGAVESNATAVATTRTQFWSSALANSVFQTETGAAAPAYAWTGTTTGGAATATTCSDWTSASAGVQGKQGDTNATNNTWLAHSDVACNLTKAIYCISQYDVATPTNLTAQAGSGGAGRVDLILTLPTNRSRYYAVRLQRTDGAAAPNYACTNGSTVKTTTIASTDTALNFTDDNAIPAGNTFSYRACIVDAAGFVVEGKSVTSVTSSN